MKPSLVTLNNVIERRIGKGLLLNMQRPLNNMQEAQKVISFLSRYGELLHYRFYRCPDTQKYKKLGRVVFDVNTDVTLFERKTLRIDEMNLDFTLQGDSKANVFLVNEVSEFQGFKTKSKVPLDPSSVETTT